MEAKDIRGDKLRKLFDHWEARQEPDRLPGQRYIKACDVDDAMDLISVVEVRTDPLRFGFRLCGRSHVDRFGRDLTGESLDEVPDRAVRIAMSEWCCTALTSDAPVLRHFDGMVEGHHSSYEALILPLGGDAEGAGKLLMAIDFDYQSEHPLISLAS